ncbi:MAG: hypothetical protein HZB76_07540 [Chlamydiae bacterium]|nr:hypothetical protein [Chlamydiota bacterium]
MTLSKYSGYFHDGSLINFKHVGNKVEISMLSAEIIPEHMIKNMPPLNKNRITGKLYLDGIKKIKINNEPFTGTLKKMYDSGSILDFEVLKHKVILGIEWTDYPPKPRKSDFSKIEIEAEKIRWENIPDLSDDCCKED